MTYTPLAPFGSTKRKATQDMKCKTCHLACWTSEFGCAGCAFVGLSVATCSNPSPVNIVVLLLLLQIATTLPCVISTDTNTFILVLLRL